MPLYIILKSLQLYHFNNTNVNLEMAKKIDQDIFLGPGWMPRFFLIAVRCHRTSFNGDFSTFKLSFLASVWCQLVVGRLLWRLSRPLCVGADARTWIRDTPAEIRSTLAFRNTALPWWTPRRVSTGDEQSVGEKWPGHSEVVRCMYVMQSPPRHHDALQTQYSLPTCRSCPVRLMSWVDA